MEDILKILGAEQPFEKDGELSKEGADAYDKLTKIITHLNNIGVIKETLDQCEHYFDEIMELGF